MAFQLSDTVNKEKVFLVKRSDLEGRLDCEYYRPERKTFFARLKSSAFVGKLQGVIAEGSYGVLPPGDCYDERHPVKFIRATDLRPDLTLDLGAYKKVPQNYFENHKRSRLKENDILLAVKGATIASEKCVAYIPHHIENAIINGSIFRFQCKELFMPEYIAFMLELPCTKKQMKFNLVANNAVDYVDKSLINNLLLFLPPPEIQAQIVAKMNVAYSTKKQKEAQAQQLLDSIDSYLLHELGIDLPAEEENSISQRMFVRKFSEVSGGRFDAPGNLSRLSLASTIFDNVEFARQVEINPLTDLSFADDTAEATFVPMEAVSEIYAEADQSQKRALAEAKGYTVFQDGDLIWAKITPCMENGKSAVVHELLNRVGFGSTEFHVFRGKDGVYIEYIHALLRLKCLRRNAVNFFSGSAGHQRVDELFFRKLTIPLPPLEKQNEIAVHIQTIRDQAKQLRAEAAAGLENAKQEVEAMILGKDSNQ